MADTDLATTIATAASLPKSATGDNGSATQHNLPELIQADQYLAEKRRVGPGFRIGKGVASGTR